MQISKVLLITTTIFSIVLLTNAPAIAEYKLGRPATSNEVTAWNLDVGPDGRGLPSGRGSAQKGKEVYETQCASCHGTNGEGGIGDKLVGGQGTLASGKPVKTVGSFWPYATTLFDYVRRAMPLNAPQSLTNEEVYAVSAYILSLNGIVPSNVTLDAKSLAAIKMPNKDGFIDDTRPDVKSSACMKNC